MIYSNIKSGILLISFFFVSNVSSLVAQNFNNASRALHVGLNAALNTIAIANQNNYGQREMDYNPQIGVAGGLMVQYRLSPRNYVLLEANYQQQGQKYDDTFSAGNFQRDVDFTYVMIPIMYKRMLGEESVGYSGVGAETKPHWFILGGLQFGKLLSADVAWRLNGNDTDFMTFVNEGGNANEATIAANGTPSEAEGFFQDIDLAFVASGGFNMALAPGMQFALELRGGIGLTDINASEWRLPNREGVYEASRTTFLGIQASLAFQIWGAR